MTYYHMEITRIKNTCYANKGQLETAIRTRHFIVNNFDQDLNLKVLSAATFTSKFHLLRLYKKYYGYTPKHYLMEKRIEQAKQLLTQGKPVAETCFDIGFESPSSFSTLFKSRVGHSPIEYQKRATFAKSVSGLL